MVKLQIKQYPNKTTGEMVTSYKVGMMNAFGIGMTINDCIFGQFALEPRIEPRNTIDKQTGQPKTFMSIKAAVRWLNYDYSDPNMMPDNYGCFNLDLPEGLTPILKSQQWQGRYFMIYLEQFKSKAGDNRTKFKLVECDCNGNVLPQQPVPQYNNPVPQNRQTTPQYYPGAPQPNVPTNAHVMNPNSGLPAGQNRVTGPQIAQYGQQFAPQQPSYQVPAQNVFPRQPIQQNYPNQMNSAAQVAMQHNPQNPPAVQYPGMNIQNQAQPLPALNINRTVQAPATVPVMNPMPPLPQPPLPTMNNNVPVMPTNQAMPQAPIGMAQGSVPNMPQQPNATQPGVNSNKTHTSYEKFGLNAQEVEVLESLLYSPDLTVWKDAADKSQQSFNEAMMIVPNALRQKGINVNPINESRLQLLWDCWNTL